MPAPALPHRFGCAKCFGDDPDAACEHRLDIVARLIDDSHFIILLRRCPDCRQDFVSIFTEFIDWADGDDPQYRDIMPLTAEEATMLRSMGEQVDLAWLERIGRDRRRLCMRHPKGEPRRCYWAEGGLSIYRSSG
jgi:hypothetical protein